MVKVNFSDAWTVTDNDTEQVVRAMIKSYNDTTDQHVRPLTYDDVTSDPRHGIVQAAKAVIAKLREMGWKPPTPIGGD